MHYHDTIIARRACGNFRSPAPRERYPKNFFCLFPRAGHKDSFASQPARVPRNHFSRCNPRALPEIKDNRFPLHKRSVSTYPSPLTPAFLQPSASREMSAVSRPDLPPGRGGQRGTPGRGDRVPPPGEPFPATFPFVGKSRPRGAKTNNF